MAQEFLDYSDGCLVLQEMGGKGVAYGMGGYLLFEFTVFHVSADDPFRPLVAQIPASIVEDEAAGVFVIGEKF